MEHKKATDNRETSKADTASDSKRLLKIPPPPPLAPDYGPPIAPGDRYLVKRGGFMVSLPSKAKKKRGVVNED